MEFDWSKKTVADWQQLLKLAPKSNWMQSWPYAKAIRMRDQKMTRLAVIRDGENEIGLMALQEIKLGPIHIVNLHRGPLWFSENPPKDYLTRFAELFNKQFPARLLRRRRWLPEWSVGQREPFELERLGFKPKKKEPYKTLWLDLSPSLDTLRSGLKQKWRNALNKSEKSNLVVKEDWRASQLPLFLQMYQAHKLSKGYLNQGPQFIKEEIQAAVPFGDVVILWAFKDHLPVAGIMVLLHGHCASYRVGWTTEVGRKLNAHNLLLWRAVSALKEQGRTEHLDLGGVDFENGEGLSRFKQGLGGHEFTSLGLWS